MGLSGRWRSVVLALLASAGVPMTATGCSDSGEPTKVEQVAETTHSLEVSAFPAHAARQWMVTLANCVKFDGISPPVAARTYSYAAIAMYEALVHGMPGYKSLAGQLNGLPSLPQPDPGLEYDWPSVLAATMDRLVRHPLPGSLFAYPNRIFFEFTTFTQSALFKLGPTQLGYRGTAGVPANVIQNSVDYGNQLADTLIPWIVADGYFDLRYKGFIPPQGPQYWVPTGFSDTDKVENPLEPHFGELRPLVLTSPDECAPPAPPPFSTDPASAMYAEANAVYQTDINLTDAQIETARFWADGPKDTATPSGHWLAIANQLLRNKNLAEAARGYALTSIGYFDAFIAVWQSKFVHNLLRPETYIRRHISADWRPLLPTPQFPEYVSGHSGQSMAAAVMFTEVFGGGAFTDNTKLRRGFASRSFASFTAAADEAAISRVYGGIHYPMGSNEGKVLGTCVGNAIKTRIDITE